MKKILLLIFLLIYAGVSLAESRASINGNYSGRVYLTSTQPSSCPAGGAYQDNYFSAKLTKKGKIRVLWAGYYLMRGGFLANGKGYLVKANRDSYTKDSLRVTKIRATQANVNFSFVTTYYGEPCKYVFKGVFGRY